MQPRGKEPLKVFTPAPVAKTHESAFVKPGAVVALSSAVGKERPNGLLKPNFALTSHFEFINIEYKLL